MTDAAFFHALADAAERETLPRFRAGTTVANKKRGGFDPVTEADREAERAMRAMIEARFPDHAIVGEEFGRTDGEREWTWVLDPIDGTRAFVSGLPVWGTLIGLYRNGRPHAGMMAQPFTKERFWSVGAGSQARWHGRDRRLVTSAVTALADATLMTTDPRLFGDGERAAFRRLEGAVRMSRYGCDCYAYAMVAAGEVDLVVESGLQLYDVAALIPVIEGAGGVVTAWDGGDAGRGGRVVAAANATLHAAALSVLERTGAGHEGVEG